MKTLFQLLFFIAFICLAAGCDKTEELTINEDVNLKNAQPVSVTLPFDANFIGEYVGEYYPGDENYSCDIPYYCRVVVEVVGNGTHLGKFTGTFDFCACGPEDPNLPSPNWQYAPSETVFVAANGDSLFVSGSSGSVIAGRADDHPEYVTSYWRDEFVILGGTGRFEGASGGGMSDDFNSSLDPNSHHHWYGEITMVKGKR